MQIRSRDFSGPLSPKKSFTVKIATVYVRSYLTKLVCVWKAHLSSKLRVKSYFLLKKSEGAVYIRMRLLRSCTLIKNENSQKVILFRDERDFSGPLSRKKSFTVKIATVYVRSYLTKLVCVWQHLNMFQVSSFKFIIIIYNNLFTIPLDRKGSLNFVFFLTIFV